MARYADSNGLDENVAYGNAWRYRDYVVAAFNADKPYDRFLLEQLAGDLLPADRRRRPTHERLIATGFLALGPKVLAEVDEAKMEMDIVDEQIDTLGRAFLGLTLGCARCHDHKFDPILAADYYGLAGIFKSTQTMELVQEGRAVARELARHRRGPGAAGDAHDEEGRRRRRPRSTAWSPRPTRGSGPRAWRRFDAARDARSARIREATKAELKQLRDELAALEKAAPELPVGDGRGRGQGRRRARSTSAATT